MQERLPHSKKTLKRKTWLDEPQAPKLPRPFSAPLSEAQEAEGWRGPSALVDGPAAGSTAPEPEGNEEPVWRSHLSLLRLCRLNKAKLLFPSSGGEKSFITSSFPGSYLCFPFSY